MILWARDADLPSMGFCSHEAVLDTCRFQPTRKGAINGYLWRADNAWHPNRSPLTVRQAAESYMEGHLAGEHGFSIPDDMDVFYVSRQDIDDTPTVSHSQALDTA